MRYHFNLHDADGLIRDEEGSEFADLEAARAEARACARELAMEDLRNDRPSHGWRVVISDPNGEMLESVRMEIATSGDAPNRPSSAKFIWIGLVLAVALGAAVVAYAILRGPLPN